MLEAKNHLRNLYRTNPDEKSRDTYLRLDMNEGVPGLPEDFVERILSGVNPAFLASYPEYAGLRKKIADYNGLNPENICLSNGSDGAIKYIFDAYVSAGDKVLLTDPSFAMYPVYCRMFNAEPVLVEYKDDLSFPENDFSGRISSDIKLAVLVNPNNPTGSAIKKDTLISVIEKAKVNDVLVIVDEAYFYFYPNTIIDKVRDYDNLITLRTFSKLCSMASVRIGYAAASSGITENMRRVRPTYDVNGLGVMLAQGLLDNPDIIKDLICRASEGKKFLTDMLSENGIKHEAGSANFILIKCPGRVVEIIQKLSRENILVNGGFKQTFLKDYIRVTIGDRTTMEKFWKPFLKIWENKHD